MRSFYAPLWRDGSGSGVYLTPPGPGGKGDCENGFYFGFGVVQIDFRSHRNLA